MLVSSGYRKHGFDASCGKVLKQSDMKHWFGSPALTSPRGVCFELGEEIEYVEPDFFEILPTINEIRVLNPECVIMLSPEAEALIKKNNVLMRGKFGAAAEKFARKYGLRFLPLDTVIASAGDYYDRGVDIISLCFYDDGSAYIHQDCRCPGISAGNTGGGELSFDLPKDFYLTMTPKDIAEKCWSSCYNAILENGILSGLMKKARERNGFLLDPSQADAKSRDK